MIVGCPVCPNREDSERTTQINEILVQQHTKFRKRLYTFIVLFSLFQGTLLYAYRWITTQTERHSREICYQLTNSAEVVYLDDKCYLPNVEGGLDFVVDLGQLGYERTRIRLLD